MDVSQFNFVSPYTENLVNHIQANDIDYTLASYQYEIIKDEIKDFEKTLDDEHEVCLKLCDFGQSISMNVVEIGYADPDLIFYYGYINGQYAQLIQHINQINFLLVSVQKEDPDVPARRIGFVVNNDADNMQHPHQLSD